MISIHTIHTVAKYETKTLLRSWFFKIFAGLSIFFLGVFDLAVFLADSGSPWIFRALPAAIPYANLLLLNLGQAIVAVFLASEFLKQDRKNDTIEVIYARSMTNTEYIAGKAIGILVVFFILNLLILLMSIGFSFLSNDSSQSLWELFYYPLLISLPTLIFILGLSFFLMIVLKNQAITFILLLGYIALTIFYLNTKYYHLFDYIAYQVPMMDSTIGGFGNFKEILIHRAIYFLFGLGLIFFTISKLQRLPQSKNMVSLPLYLAILFLILGGFLSTKYINLKKGDLEFKNKLIRINNKYVAFPKSEVKECHIDLTHLDEEISVMAKLKIYNGSGQNLDTLIFSLNPSLKVTSVMLNDQNMDFQRELQVLKVILTTKMQSGQTLDLDLSYHGFIDERTHFLDQNQKNFEDNFSAQLFRIRKRYSYLLKNFVCLTSEALWYPVSGVGYASENPSLYLPDFTQYTLKVKTSDKLTAISQGKTNQVEKGVFDFKPEYPLPKISLLIGDYIQHSTLVDSIEYSIYSMKKNQFYLDHFTSLRDSIPSLIRELKNEYESKVELKYPFKRFSLAEVPIHFSLDKHLWSISSDAVQPEIIFYPEKGVVMEESDFKKRKKRAEKQMKRENEEISEEELQSRIFKRFVRANFMATPEEWFQYNDLIDRNTFTPFPNYFSYRTQLCSPNYPVLNLGLEVYLKDKNEKMQSHSRSRFEGMSKEESINLELKQASLEELTKSGLKLSGEDEQVFLNDIFQAKGIQLFSMLKAQFGEVEFNNFLEEVIEKNAHCAFTFHEFDSLLNIRFGESISTQVANWYSKKELPGFLIKDLQTYKVKEDEHLKYQVLFKISNPESVDGIVSVNIELDNQNNRNQRNRENSQAAFSKVIHVPAKKAFEVGFIFPKQPGRMNIYTHISQNLPNNLTYDFNSFSETKKTNVLNKIRECEPFSEISDKDEIIVDNEDTGFEYFQTSNKSVLKQWLDEKRTLNHEYSHLRPWNPPNEWNKVLRSGFYGKYIQSAYFTKSGPETRSALWKADIKEGALYDVFCYIEKMNERGRRREKKSDYNFKIYHEGGVEEVNKTDQELESGWNYLGTFFITPETAKVELSNKSTGPFLFADAIKWVKTK